MHHTSHPYRRLVLMTLLSFAAMYLLMYAMVNTIFDALPNYNQFYMAGLMAMPMIGIELMFMGTMYPDKRLNRTLIAASVGLGILFFLCIRNQTFVDDTQFLKSMIPHHSSAILMCTHATLQDTEIQKLCAGIVSGQQKEIDAMRLLLEQR